MGKPRVTKLERVCASGEGNRPKNIKKEKNKEIMKLNIGNLKLPKRVWMPVLMVVAAVALVGGIVFAASFALNQTVPATVDIVAVAGGGSPPPPPPGGGSIPTNVFTTAALTDIVTALDFGAVTTVGGSPTVVVFVDHAKMLASTVTVTAPSLPSSYALTKTAFDDTTGSMTLTLVVPSGQTIADNVTLGNVSFVGSLTP